MKTTDDKTAALEAPDAGVVAELVEAGKNLRAFTSVFAMGDTAMAVALAEWDAALAKLGVR